MKALVRSKNSLRSIPPQVPAYSATRIAADPIAKTNVAMITARRATLRLALVRRGRKVKSARLRGSGAQTSIGSDPQSQKTVSLKAVKARR
jgi:hypothetical protein